MATVWLENLHEVNVKIELLSVKDINGDAGESMILMIDGEDCRRRRSSVFLFL